MRRRLLHVSYLEMETDTVTWRSIKVIYGFKIMKGPYVPLCILIVKPDEFGCVHELYHRAEQSSLSFNVAWRHAAYVRLTFDRLYWCVLLVVSPAPKKVKWSGECVNRCGGSSLDSGGWIGYCGTNRLMVPFIH